MTENKDCPSFLSAFREPSHRLGSSICLIDTENFKKMLILIISFSTNVAREHTLNTNFIATEYFKLQQIL